jgi:hypothetical protein
VFATSPTLVTPALGTPSSAVLTNATGYTTANLVGTISNAQLANSTISGVSLGGSLANLTAGTNITFSAGTTYNGSAAITISATGAAQVYPGAGIANSTGTAWGTSYTTTGTGTVVALATSPTFVTPVLGTPTSGTLTNTTGFPAANLAGTALPSAIVTSSLTALGTVATGVWNGTAIGIAYGGTGQTTASAGFNALSPITTTGDLILGNGTNSATRLAIGANTYVLTSNGTTASWQAASGGGSSISNGTSNVTVNSSGGTVTIATAGTTALTVSTTQNVGIGQTSPSFRLDVSGIAGTNGDAVRNMELFDSSSAYVGGGGGIAFGGYYNGTSSAINDFAGIQGFKENSTAGDYAGALRFTTRVNGGSPTERLRLNSTGALVLQGGTTTANGVGIAFPATQSASTNANTLDDYEEGTWTPVLTGLTVTFAYRVASYTKIGNMVYLFFDLEVNSYTGTWTGSVSGLPFVISTAMGGYSVVQYRASTLFTTTTVGGQLKGYAEAGYSYFVLQIDNSGVSGFGSAGGPTINASGRLTGYVIYQS